jgi:hypothetical protein
VGQLVRVVLVLVEHLVVVVVQLLVVVVGVDWLMQTIYP